MPFYISVIDGLSLLQKLSSNMKFSIRRNCHVYLPLIWQARRDTYFQLFSDMFTQFKSFRSFTSDYLLNSSKYR